MSTSGGSEIARSEIGVSSPIRSVAAVTIDNGGAVRDPIAKSGLESRAVVEVETPLVCCLGVGRHWLQLLHLPWLYQDEEVKMP